MSERWKPRYGQEYWFWGKFEQSALRAEWNGGVADQILYHKGNVHATKEAAEKWGKEQEENK